MEKLSKEERIDFMYDLINSFGRIRSSSEAAYFLEDLLTANEIKNLSTRLRIAKLLLKGESQREICRKSGASLGTVNKVNIWLKEGGQGFKNIISKLPAKWKKPTRIPRGPIEFHLPELLLAGSQYMVANKQENLPKYLIGRQSRKKQIDKELTEMNREFYSRKTKGKAF